MGTDSLNIVSFKDNLESLVSIEISSCFVIEGGYNKFHHLAYGKVCM